MALVDTQGFVMAVDRSLFGPQGRRWIERKLPDVATNIAFIAVSAFGACTLVFHITREYHESGYWAILQTPKHVLNAVVLHLVARALRWHVDRMLGLNFAAGDEVRFPAFFVVVFCLLVPRVGRSRVLLARCLWCMAIRTRNLHVSLPFGAPSGETTVCDAQQPTEPALHRMGHINASRMPRRCLLVRLFEPHLSLFFSRRQGAGRWVASVSELVFLPARTKTQFANLATALPDFFGASARGGGDSGGDHNDKGGVLWPWQSSHGPARTPQQPKVYLVVGPIHDESVSVLARWRGRLILAVSQPQ
ncbi:unnamed protein product [Scytosiphon promiscuus]